MDQKFETNQQIVQRIANLKNQYQAGLKHLQELEQEETRLRETLLQIGDAIKALEELLSANR
jgi:predicted nuclease with TOPRIM domain